MPSNFLDNLLHQEHTELIQSLEAKQNRLRTALLVIQEIVPNWHQLERSERLFALVDALEKGCAYYDNVLATLRDSSLIKEVATSKKNDVAEPKSNFSKDSAANVNCLEETSNNWGIPDILEHEIGLQQVINSGQPQVGNSGDSTAKNPKDFLLPEFRDRSSMFEVIEILLNRAQKPLGTDDISRMAYCEVSAADFERIKGSVAAQLRRGATQGKWVKTNRGLYVAHKAATQPSTQSPELETSPWEDEPSSFRSSNGKHPTAATRN